MKWCGFFEFEERLSRLSGLDDQLEASSCIIFADFSFWSELMPPLGSNPEHETITLFKTQSENQFREPAINTPKI